jgi:threonine/homoserine/homoserine lactone efflux protein
MNASLFIALVTFAFISAYTPGPNNALLLATGVNYGFRAALPMIFGVALGFPFLILSVGLGLGRIFDVYPFLLTAIKIVGTIYMLWLAWKIATSRPSENDSTSASKPLNFIQGCGFQWVNPKAWIIGAYSISAFTLPTQFNVGLSILVGVYVFMGLTSATTWAAFGVALKNLMNDSKWFRIINYSLAAALVASIALMLME